MSIGPYGYTLTVWTSGAVLAHARGLPTSVEALLFMLGGVVGFAIVGMAAFGDLRARVEVDPTPPALWGGLHFISVAAAIGAVTVIADQVENAAAWPLGGFTATVLYLVLLAAQLALAG